MRVDANLRYTVLRDFSCFDSFMTCTNLSRCVDVACHMLFGERIISSVLLAQPSQQALCVIIADDGHLGANVMPDVALSTCFGRLQLICEITAPNKMVSMESQQHQRPHHRGADVQCAATHYIWIIACNNWKRNETSSHRQPIQFAFLKQ